MKVLHTADWHLGHRLHEQSQHQEQQLFLNWLAQLIVEESYEVLLISGDVFDTGMPSNQSLSMYYNFLIDIHKTCCKHVIITGGNHDSPGTLNAPKALLSALSIKVVGKAMENIKEEVFKIETSDEQIYIAAVPYLRDQDVRKAVAGERFDDINERYKSALINHYNTIADEIEQQNTHVNPVIAMGHLFAIGGSISDSEKDISVGNLGHIGANDFPNTFDYVALGHLHKPQQVGNKNHIRYSGSPVVLSFSEIGYDKKVTGIEISTNRIRNISEILVPQFRDIIQVKGDTEDCISQLKNIQQDKELETWVEVILNEDSNAVDISEIKQTAESLSLKILKITLKNKREHLGIEALLENVKQIKTLKPIEVFKQKCEEENISLEENKELLDAFNEALLIAQEQS
ncbi:exonuclease SbcCD subunit D C-terminal domain-containing protein [Wenyingzhuangia sp. IMCC45533]